MKVMNEKEILREAQKETGLKQTEIAERLGVNQATVSTNMRRDKIGLDVFNKLLSVMGYCVTVGRKTENGFEAVWEVESRF